MDMDRPRLNDIRKKTCRVGPCDGTSTDCRIVAGVPGVEAKLGLGLNPTAYAGHVFAKGSVAV